MNLLIIGEPKTSKETYLVLTPIMRTHDVKNVILVENFGLLNSKSKDMLVHYRNVNFITVGGSVSEGVESHLHNAYKKAIELVSGGIIVAFPPADDANLFMQLLESHGTGGEKIVSFFERDFGEDHHFSKD